MRALLIGLVLASALLALGFTFVILTDEQLPPLPVPVHLDGKPVHRPLSEREFLIVDPMKARRA
jgi:hypothetical protein